MAEAPGKLKNRDDRKVLGTEKEKTVLTPQTKDYNQFGQECVAVGCTVDLFLFNNAYVDVATLSQVRHRALKSGKKVQKIREITFHKKNLPKKCNLMGPLFASKAKINVFWNFIEPSREIKKPTESSKWESAIEKKSEFSWLEIGKLIISELFFKNV